MAVPWWQMLRTESWETLDLVRGPFATSAPTILGLAVGFDRPDLHQNISGQSQENSEADSEVHIGIGPASSGSLAWGGGSCVPGRPPSAQWVQDEPGEHLTLVLRAKLSDSECSRQPHGVSFYKWEHVLAMGDVQDQHAGPASGRPLVGQPLTPQLLDEVGTPEVGISPDSLGYIM